MNAARRLRAAVGFGLLCLLATVTHAGMVSPCEDPTVLSGARVQVFIFPYASDTRLTPQGRALATLMQRHVLFAALKYPSIGVAELTESTGRCNFEKVAEKIRAQLGAGQTAIFLYGRVFEQGANIYLKSFVSVAAEAGARTTRWSLASSGQTTITTATPADVQAFGPRTIPLSFLERLESSQKQARRVHSEPNGQSRFVDLPANPADRFTFLVLGARDDWMQIRVLSSGVEGWVPAHALATSDQLKGEFPELYFVDGLVGYYSLTLGAERLANVTRASLERYLQATQSLPESDPRAHALTLMGNSRLRVSGIELSTAALKSAQLDYIRAVAASPTWTPALSHQLASTALLCTRVGCGEDARLLEAQYLEAIGGDPLSRELVGSLAAFYEAASMGRVASGLTPADLATKRATLREVQSGMRGQ